MRPFSIRKKYKLPLKTIQALAAPVPQYLALKRYPLSLLLSLSALIAVTGIDVQNAYGQNGYPRQAQQRHYDEHQNNIRRQYYSGNDYEDDAPQGYEDDQGGAYYNNAPPQHMPPRRYYNNAPPQNAPSRPYRSAHRYSDPDSGYQRGTPFGDDQAPLPPQESLWRDAIPDFSQPFQRFMVHIDLMGGVSKEVVDYTGPNNDRRQGDFTFQFGGNFGIMIFASKHFALDLSETLTDQLFKVKEGTNYTGEVANIVLSTFTYNLQYHVFPTLTFDPFFGLGGSFLVPLSPLTDTPDIRSSTKYHPGWDVEIGLDLKLTRHFYLRLDTKKVWNKFTIQEISGSTKTNYDVHPNPWLFSIGIGWRF